MPKAKYLLLKEQIFYKILDGTYPNGFTIPPEYQLMKDFSFSRVTVRNALNVLKKEGTLSSSQGRGTVVTHRKGGFKGSMEVIALVASVQDSFFSSFYQHF